MNKKKPPVFQSIIMGAVVGAIVGPIVLSIPFIGPIFLLPLAPLVNAFDSVIPGEFTSTGQHVVIGFAWITYRTIEAQFFFATFFAYIGAVIGLIIRLVRFLPQKVFLGILVIILLLMLAILF